MGLGDRPQVPSREDFEATIQMLVTRAQAAEKRITELRAERDEARARVAELEAANEMLLATDPPAGSVVYPPGALDKHEQRIEELEAALRKAVEDG